MVKDYTEFEILGGTRDDAAGEAFDKVARVLGVGYPGGPKIDALAQNGDPKRYKLPDSRIKDAPLDFSFSGLKTAVINLAHNAEQKGETLDREGLAASFCTAVVHTLVPRLEEAVHQTVNGICHQVQLERFGVPGYTLLGSDSHTPTGGGIGMLAIGAGGLDVAVAMGGGAYYLACPRVVGVRLHGKLSYGVAAKDIILEVLRRLTVKGGVGKVMEYIGDGVKTLSVPERATITNMGAELGATTSIFPSDEVTHAFLKAQQREQDFVPLSADPDAAYDEILDIDLTALEPLVAKPHMPDIVETVKQCGPIKVDQVFIGSCTNSSYTDMMRVARILKGKTVHPDVSLVIGPGSKQVLTMLARNGALADMIAAGARILESACGPCIGMGQSPRTNAVSVRTNNRNFYGRSGTKSAGIYLVSCETAAVTALTGVLTDPRCLDIDLDIPMPETYTVNDNLVIPPVAPGEEDTVEVVRGPNIQPFPLGKPLADAISGKVLLTRPVSMRRSFRCIWASRLSCASPSRANPQGKSGQLRHHSADLRRSGGLRCDQSARRDLSAERSRGSKERRAGHGRLRRQDLQGRLRGFRASAPCAARGRHAALRASAGEQVRAETGAADRENVCPVRLDRMTLIC